MIKKFYFWIYTQKKEKQHLEEIFVYYVHSILSHNIQIVEANQVPTDRWMEKQNVVFTYNKVLLSLKKKEWNSDTC